LVAIFGFFGSGLDQNAHPFLTKARLARISLA